MSYHIDGNTKLEFVDRKKTQRIITKDKFFVCKQMLLQNAPQEDFANFLNIPLDKVKFFKYKIQQFEDGIRARRRAAKLQKQRKKDAKSEPVRKREISSEERFRRARELISRGLGTNQISKILKVSERSVTRFKRRMREEKQRLKAEGKIFVDPNDPDDESSFKHLAPEDKIKKAEELFRKRLKIQEISEILKISERSVRRWKDKLDKGKEDNKPVVTAMEVSDDKIVKLEPKTKQAVRISKTEEFIVNETIEEDIEDPSTPTTKKKRRLYVDREKVQYAKELMENRLSNKEMSMLLEISIACVRKLKTKINDGTVEELIDDSEEHYNKVNKPEVEFEIEPDNISDPLNVLDYTELPVVSPLYVIERKPKTILRERDMFIARLLRDNNIRTMDIAKMMKISERSVTRLLAKSKDTAVMTYELDIVVEVEHMLADKEKLLCATEPGLPAAQNIETKRQVCKSLLSMNVSIKDIAKMLDLPEKSVQLWKACLQKESAETEMEDQTFDKIFEAADEEEVIYEDEEFHLQC